MPKILAFIGHYLPGFKGGGPVRSLSNLIECLGDELTFYVVTADRDLGDTQPYRNGMPGSWESVNKARVFYLPPNRRGLLYLRNLLRTAGYDLIYLNSFFDSLTRKVLFLRWLRQIPTKPIILAPRGEFSPGAFALKNFKKRVYVAFVKRVGLYKNLFWHATNDQEGKDILRFLGPQIDRPRSIRIASNLSPGLPATQQTYHPNLTKQANSARIIFLSRISPKKNLHLALEILSDISGNVEFDIYGPIEDKRYWQKCQLLFQKLQPNVKAIYKGVAKPGEVFDLFSQYHLFLFLTRGENFGHVIIEALSAGCPVLTTDQTPWLNLADNKAGWNVSLKEPGQSSAALNELISMDNITFKAWSKSAREYANNVASNSGAAEAHRKMFLEILNMSEEE